MDTAGIKIFIIKICTKNAMRSDEYTQIDRFLLE